MQLFPSELEINSTEGFTPEKDIFGRKPFGDQLTRIVRALENPSVLLLDAPWGTGKSTFVKMWRGELLKERISSIYFDAFANDYQEDAFLAVASQLIAEADRQAPRTAKVLSSFKANALQAAKILGRASLRVAIHAATAGLIEGEALEKGAAELTKAFGDEATKVIDEALKARLESHESDRKAFENFKTTLAQLAVALSSQQTTDKSARHDGPSTRGSDRPLVFIIDELDRCRPTFALELLEKIKHFFSVPGVIFILVSSLSQLEIAVRFAYGEVDAHTYLEKFYHLRILMPIGKSDRQDLTTATYLSHLDCNKHVTEILDEFSRIHPLSLRTLERIAAYSKIIQISMPKKGLLLPQIIAVLCVIRVLRPQLL